METGRAVRLPGPAAGGRGEDAAGDRLRIGTGQDSAWFREQGFDVTAVDASPAMVELTRAKGVPAHLRHVLDLGLPGKSCDAVYSINTLLHVPNEDLDVALGAIHDVLAPGGLFFLGIYGGASTEGISAPIRTIRPGSSRSEPIETFWRTRESSSKLSTSTWSTRPTSGDSRP